MCISGSSHSPCAREAVQQHQLHRASFQWNLPLDVSLHQHLCPVDAKMLQKVKKGHWLHEISCTKDFSVVL